MRRLELAEALGRAAELVGRRKRRRELAETSGKPLSHGEVNPRAAAEALGQAAELAEALGQAAELSGKLLIRPELSYQVDGLSQVPGRFTPCQSRGTWTNLMHALGT